MTLNETFHLLLSSNAFCLLLEKYDLLVESHKKLLDAFRPLPHPHDPPPPKGAQARIREEVKQRLEKKSLWLLKILSCQDEARFAQTPLP